MLCLYYKYRYVTRFLRSQTFPITKRNFFPREKVDNSFNKENNLGKVRMENLRDIPYRIYTTTRNLVKTW